MRFPGKSSPAATASAGSSTAENRSRFSFGVLAAMLVCAAAFLGIGAPTASAAPEAEPGWSYRSSLGSLAGAIYDTARNPVSVDGNGNVFAVVQNDVVARVFSPSGELLTEASNGVPRNAAVDVTDDTLYLDELSGFGANLVTRYVSDGNPTPTYTADPGFQVPQGDGMAVDPTTHDLLIADPGSEAVRRYDTTGTLVDTISTPGITPAWIVVAPDGSFFVAPAEGPDVTHFNGTGTQLGVIAGVGQLHGLAFDPVRQLVAVNVGDTIKTYSPSGILRSEVPAHGSSGLGIVVDGGGLLYEHTGSTVNAYVPAVIPGVDGLLVSDVTADSAHLSVEVDPGAGPPEGSAVRFEYSEDGGEEWTSLPDIGVGAAGTFEADLTDLTLNRDFLVRAKALNSLASKTSAAVPFSTPEIAPLVVTGAASARTETGAVLNGTVNPAGQLTTYHFEYGPTTAYGNRVPVATEAAAGDTRQPRAVARAIAGLQPETTYHYRLVASNATGETAGADRTFTTVGSAEAAPARAYEQVTPVDQHGALVNGTTQFWSGIDGSWFVTGSGAAEPDGTSSVIWQHFLSRRGSTGWSDWSQIDPPRSSSDFTTEGTVAGVSDDGSHALVISNRVLDTGGIAGGGNLYVYDIENGTYEFVGGVSDEDFDGAYSWIAGLQKTPDVFVWGSSDFSTVIFRTIPPLLPGVSVDQLYRWSRSGGLELESTMPDGEPPSGGLPALATASQADLRQVSEDGSVSYFSIFGADFGVYRRAGGQTVPISVIEGDTTHTPQFGELKGISRDGRYAYFLTFTALTPDDPGTGTGFYRYDAESEGLTYLAQIQFASGSMRSISDDGKTAYFQDGTRVLVARGDQTRVVGPQVGYSAMSPSGRYFIYPVVGRVMLYDAEADSSTCVSCLPDGSEGEAAYLMNPGRTPGNHVPRLAFDNGLVVFSTKNQLVSADRNGAYDVYTYQNGQVSLISPGDGPYDAIVTEAAAEGRDIFFTTDEALVPQDTNGATDVYDARVGGGFAEPPAIRQCDGEGCKGPLATPPTAPVPGTSVPGSGGSARAGAIGKVKKLTASERATLARGGKAHLKVAVNGPGKVTVSGKASGSARAKKAGTVSVPISLSNGALSELKEKGSLTLSLTVHFKDARPKAVSVTLRTTTSKKGGSR